MDTEKHIEIEKKIRVGKSLSDEGPYYHHAWWESYKGGVKGKLGGLVIGAIVGLVVGAVVAGALAAAQVAAPLVGLTLAGFAGAGMMYGAHEFGDVGKIVGSGAAQSQQLETRMKMFMDGKVAEVKEEIGELKSMVSGKQAENKQELQAAKTAAADDEKNYRKSHYAKIKPDRANTFAFWKVALIGLAIGAVAGGLLAIGGTGSAAAYILGHILTHDAIVAMGAPGIAAASIATMGALGASFGINRDFFRRVFDKTDLWFKGVINGKDHDLVREQQVATGKAIEEKVNGIGAVEVTPAIPEPGISYPKSETHFRDKVLPAAQRALLSFDHTRATPQ